MAGIKGLVDSSASCGAANPLMKLTNHISKDQGKSDFLRYSQTDKDGASNSLEKEFETFQRKSLGQPQTFNLSGLLHELQPPTKVNLDKQWTDEFQQSNFTIQNNLQLRNNISTATSEPTTSSTFKIAANQNSSNWAQEYLNEIPLIENSVSKEAAKLSETLDEDPRFSSSQFKSFVKGLEMTDDDTKWTSEFVNQSGSNQAQATPIQSDQWVEEFVDVTDSDVQAFEDQHQQEDFWSKLENQWKEMAETKEHPWLEEYEEQSVLAPYDKYVFQEDNQLKDAENCLEEGKKKLQEGDLPSAVLLFEAAVQQNPDNSEAWALLGTSQCIFWTSKEKDNNWEHQLLNNSIALQKRDFGAKNEQDPSAISALMQALKLDPGNKEAIIALAASLTNESMQSQACYALQDWMAVSQAEPSQQVQTKLHLLSSKSTTSFMSRELHQQTLDQYLSLARGQHQNGELDADVQCGLGILLNLSGDYGKAADCFRAALQARPNDAFLWNRLGASLANGDQSEEAIGAYRKALDIYPGFVRARYNLGISCINLKTYDVAVEHFLSALNFQAAARGREGSVGSDGGQAMASASVTSVDPGKVMSDNIWSSLRLTLGLMGKRELYPMIEQKNLAELNRLLNYQLGWSYSGAQSSYD